MFRAKMFRKQTYTAKSVARHATNLIELLDRGKQVDGVRYASSSVRPRNGVSRQAIAQFVQAMFEWVHHRSDHATACSQALAALDSLESNSICIKGWNILEQTCVGLGHNVAALRCRDAWSMAALQRICTDGLDSPDEVGIVWALADKDMIADLAQRTLPYLETLQATPKSNLEAVMIDAAQYVALRETQVVSAASSVRWNQLIAGSSVALVGPSPNATVVGDEIDEFDLVVQYSYGLGDHVLPPGMYGSRVDISYYNNGSVRQIDSESRLDRLRNLTVACLKSSRCFDNCPRLVDVECVRLISDFGHGFGPGRLNMAPLAILDLLTGSPSSIRLYSHTFYAYRDVYESGYVTHDDAMLSGKREFSQARKFLRHPPLTQIRFVRNLWHAGLIDADQGTKSVLSMTDLQYVTLLDKNWGVSRS